MMQLKGLSEEKDMQHALKVLSSQEVSKQDVEEYVPVLLEWMNTTNHSYRTKCASLTFLTSLSKSHSFNITPDQMLVVDSLLVTWLTGAGLTQAANPYSKSLFGKDKPPPVTELDGTPCRDMFTVLNLGQYYTDDQLLSMHTFTCLRAWLQLTRPTATTSLHNPDPLLQKTLAYCSRLLEQYERRPKVPQDADTQKSAVCEAIRLVDHVCQCCSMLVPAVFDSVKHLYRDISRDLTQPTVLLAIMQFFINHSEAVVYDPQQLYNFYFDDIIGIHFMDPAVAFDIVQFIQDNLDTLCYHIPLLKSYFPNLLKICAWFPRSHIEEFVQLLPSFLSETTAIEVFHTLLDLPVVTAAIETKLASSHSDQTHITTAIEAYSNPLYRPLFNFVLRSQGGHGDTIDRLSSVHNMLEELIGHPRVTVCAQVVPVLLRVYFNTVLSDGDRELFSRLVPVILERAGLLYGTPEYQHDVHRVLAEGLLEIFKRHPGILMDQQPDILEFISTLRNAADKEDFFIHVLWIIGEYTSATYDSRCVAEMISSLYNALECIAYELSSSLPSATTQPPPQSPRLVTVLITAMAKLASRSQDLIPRVLLCLTKLDQQLGPHISSQNAAILHSRTTELVSLLKVPNVASAVLSAPAEMTGQKWHCNSSRLPVLLHYINHTVKPQ